MEGGGERKGRREGLGHSPAEGVLCHAGLQGTGVNPGGVFAKRQRHSDYVHGHDDSQSVTMEFKLE